MGRVHLRVDRIMGLVNVFEKDLEQETRIKRTSRPRIDLGSGRKGDEQKETGTKTRNGTWI